MLHRIVKSGQYVLIFALLSLVSMGTSHVRASGEEEPGFTGADAGGKPPAPTPATSGRAVFDESLTFVPPEKLAIVDTYLRESMTARDLAEELETISVTPEGQLESMRVSIEDAEMFLRGIDAIREMEAGFEGIETRPGEAGESDLRAGEATAESVIGPDTRTRVNNTTSYPYRTIGRIDVGCTGTLIGPRHVLTAGHCVYNINTDKWYSNLNFTPGQNGATKPYGTIGWAKALSVKGWTQQHKRDYDYAMIVLKENVGNTVGWLGYGWKDPMPKYNVNINGYPGDKPFGTMWHAFCTLQIIQTYRLYYACDTYGGMSGSAVYVLLDGKRTIYGIHAYGVDSTGLNGATRIRKEVFENLKKWKSTY